MKMCLVTSSKIGKAGKFNFIYWKVWSWRNISYHQALAKLHAAGYTIFKMQAKMAMEKCYNFDWWLKWEAFCCLVMGKSRVSPTKFVSIPRLELTAAALSVKVSTLLRKELTIHLIINKYFYTDSKVVPGCINCDAKRFKIFVETEFS